METIIFFLDEKGCELSSITEDGVYCCTGDIIWIGDMEDNPKELINRSFIITKAVYNMDLAIRTLEARPYNGDL